MSVFVIPAPPALRWFRHRKGAGGDAGGTTVAELGSGSADGVAADTSRRLMRSRVDRGRAIPTGRQGQRSNMIPSAYLVELVTETGESPAQGHHRVAWLLDAWFYCLPFGAAGACAYLF